MVDSMSIIFKQFGVLEDFPTKTIIEKAPITFKKMFEILSDGRVNPIGMDIMNNGKLKDDFVLLKNGKAVNEFSFMDTILEDGDLIVLLVLTIGG